MLWSAFRADSDRGQAVFRQYALNKTGTLQAYPSLIIFSPDPRIYAALSEKEPVSKELTVMKVHRPLKKPSQDPRQSPEDIKALTESIEELNQLLRSCILQPEGQPPRFMVGMYGALEVIDL